MRSRKIQGSQPPLCAANTFSHEGILFGGSGKVRTDSLLERKARIDAIARELIDLKREQAAVEQRRVTAESQIAGGTTALEKAVASHQEAQAMQTASISKISELEREQHSAERELESLEFERQPSSDKSHRQTDRFSNSRNKAHSSKKKSPATAARSRFWKRNETKHCARRKMRVRFWRSCASPRRHMSRNIRICWRSAHPCWRAKSSWRN